MTQLGKTIRQAVSFLAFCLGFLLILEGSAQTLIFLKTVISKTPDPRSEADGFDNKLWSRAYFKEVAQVSRNAVWHPYVYWRRAPFRGQYINVDERGLRKTRAPETAAGSAKKKIFMFGGSTLWGTGAGDDDTLPSLLARRLERDSGLAVEIVNFGETGYVSTQDYLTLLLELRQGRIPDLVIFFDGVNDLFSSFQNHRAGIPQNELNRVREFNLLHPDNRLRLYREAIQGFFLTGVAQVYRSIYRRVTGKEGIGITPQVPLSLSEASSLIDETWKIYFFNLKRVSKLGEEFGFQVLFYLQPTLFQKQSKTNYEEAEEKKWLSFKGFYENALARISEFKDPALRGQFNNLSDLFGDETGPYFLDFCHVTKMGNGTLAERLASDVSTLFKTD